MFRGLLSVAMLVVFQTVAFAQQPCTTDAKHVVDELYRHILERAADPGSSGWVTSLQSGTTVREVVRQIASSPEHSQRFYNASDGALANQRAVDTLYRHILGRQPDAAGEKSYTAMAASQGLGAVVNSIVSSGEYTQTFGDWGVPGFGGLAYCGNGSSTQSATTGNRGGAGTAAVGGGRAVTGARDGAGTSNGTGTRDGAGAQYGSGNRDGAGTQYGTGNRDGAGTQYGSGNRDVAGTSGVNRNRGGYSQMMYADLDTNRDGVIERNEWRGTPNSFRLHDWNGDGVLSGDEVRYDAVPPANSRQANDYNMPNADRFSYLDVNNDGTIDRREWDGSLDAFYRLDRNNDGRLTRSEFGSVRSSSPFAVLDTNRDGRITLGEWPYSHRSFDEQDVNGDGVIAPNEFRGVPASTPGR